MSKGAIQKRLEEIEKRADVKEIAKVGYDTWIKFTPVDKGNARKKTSLVNEEIRADYPYALRLDQGWSKQNKGVGMSKPTIEAVQKYIDKKV